MDQSNLTSHCTSASHNAEPGKHTLLDIVLSKLGLTILITMIVLGLFIYPLVLLLSDHGPTPDPAKYKSLFPANASNSSTFSRLGDDLKHAKGSASASVRFSIKAGQLREQLLFHPEQMHELKKHLLNWSSLDITGALNYANGLRYQEGKGYILDALLRHTGKKNATASLAWINANIENSQKKQDLTASVFVGLAELDIQQALKSIQQIGERNIPLNARLAVAEVWAQKDAASAYEWLQLQGSETKLNQDVTLTILSHYIQQDEAMAGILIAELPQSELRSALMVNYAQQLAKTNISHAIDWSSRLNKTEKVDALKNIFDMWIQQTPWQTLSYAQNELPDSIKDEIIVDLSIYLAAKYPQELASNLASLPLSAQPRVAENLARFWSDKNSATAHDWAIELEHSAVRNLAIRGLLDNYMHNDPKAAFNLAESVDDPFIRFELVSQVTRYWSRIDPEKTKEAVEQSLLDSSEKSTLFKSL